MRASNNMSENVFFFFVKHMSENFVYDDEIPFIVNHPTKKSRTWFERLFIIMYACVVTMVKMVGNIVLCVVLL